MIFGPTELFYHNLTILENVCLILSLNKKLILEVWVGFDTRYVFGPGWMRVSTGRRVRIIKVKTISTCIRLYSDQGLFMY